MDGCTALLKKEIRFNLFGGVPVGSTIGQKTWKQVLCFWREFDIFVCICGF